MKNKSIFFIFSLLAIIAGASPALASHSWGSYHWARTSNPFTLKLGDNVTLGWEQFLNTASTDWNTSTVLGTTVTAGQSNPRNCKSVLGRVEVCNNKYGNNGWLGIAQIWINGDHITQGIVKLNDTYFTTPSYNSPAWKQFVMCQEIGHTFGLGHQDEVFSNTNLGTCMDYTDDPDGTKKGQLSNLKPNAHDFGILESIYAHLDTVTTISASALVGKQNSVHAGGSQGDNSEWGKALEYDEKGRPSHFENDLGGGNKIITHVIWAE